MNLRKCISCGKRDNKFRFIRINKIKNGDSKFEIRISNFNTTNHVDGRTAYLCPNNECLSLARKKSRIERSLKCKIDKSVYDEIDNLLNLKK